jgi:hypothetical protein
MQLWRIIKKRTIKFKAYNDFISEVLRPTDLSAYKKTKAGKTS